MFILTLWWSRISPAAGGECSADSLRSAPLNHLLYNLTITSLSNIPSYPGRDCRNDYSLGREGRRGHTARHPSNRNPRCKPAGMSFNRAGGTALRPWGIRFSIPSDWGRRPQPAAVPCGTAAAGRSERAQRAPSAAKPCSSAAASTAASIQCGAASAAAATLPPAQQRQLDKIDILFSWQRACSRFSSRIRQKKKKNGKYRVELCRIRAFWSVFVENFVLQEWLQL